MAGIEYRCIVRIGIDMLYASHSQLLVVLSGGHVVMRGSSLPHISDARQIRFQMTPDQANRLSSIVIPPMREKCRSYIGTHSNTMFRYINGTEWCASLSVDEPCK